RTRNGIVLASRWKKPAWRNGASGISRSPTRVCGWMPKAGRLPPQIAFTMATTQRTPVQRARTPALVRSSVARLLGSVRTRSAIGDSLTDEGAALLRGSISPRCREIPGARGIPARLHRGGVLRRARDRGHDGGPRTTAGAAPPPPRDGAGIPRSHHGDPRAPVLGSRRPAERRRHARR